MNNSKLISNEPSPLFLTRSDLVYSTFYQHTVTTYFIIKVSIVNFF